MDFYYLKYLLNGTDSFCFFSPFRTFLNWDIPGLFLFNFVFSIQLTVNIKFLMAGLELRTSGVGSNHSTNCATTTVHSEQLRAYN